MQDQQRRSRIPSRTGGGNPYVTSAVGLEETAGRLRARRSSLFTRTAIWITGLICLAFLLGSLAQAWSNSQLVQRVQSVQQQTQQLQNTHDRLTHMASYYKNSSVVEREAREQLGYIRPGEHALVISSPAGQNQQHTVAVASAPAQGNFWQAWLNVFFGN